MAKSHLTRKTTTTRHKHFYDLVFFCYRLVIGAWLLVIISLFGICYLVIDI
jgi:hypothetical protein